MDSYFPGQSREEHPLNISGARDLSNSDEVLTFLSLPDCQEKRHTSVRLGLDRMGASVRPLVVEDEVKLARALQEGLEAENYAVSVVHTGEEGFYVAHEQTFDLVILDVMLPGRDGLEVLATLRRRGNTTPVLLLTSPGTPSTIGCADSIPALTTTWSSPLPSPSFWPVSGRSCGGAQMMLRRS